MLSFISSCGLSGIEGFPVDVEVNLAHGMPMFEIVGLPDASVKESRERVRAALKNSGYSFPAERLTVNLAPADQKKEGPLRPAHRAGHPGVHGARGAGSGRRRVRVRRAVTGRFRAAGARHAADGHLRPGARRAARAGVGGECQRGQPYRRAGDLSGDQSVRRGVDVYPHFTPHLLTAFMAYCIIIALDMWMGKSRHTVWRADGVF